jgi:cytochrome c
MKCAVVKIFGSVLFAVVAASAAYGFGSVVVHPVPLAKNVFVVDTSTLSPPTASAPAAAADTTAASAPVALPPIAELLAKADPAAGEKFAKVCTTCHSFGKGEPAKMGPNLYGVIGLKHAHMAGFAYSDAMKAQSDKDWTFDALNKFLFNPKTAVPGTKMPFAGIKSDSDRANVIAWLRTLSDKPEPLPTK